MTKGFLGGSFDPVHLGHLTLAAEAMDQFSLEQVVFIPSRFPPHKDPDALTPFHHRFRMLEMATESNSGFQIADLEGREFPAYTVDMLERVASPGFRPVFIIGMDSLAQLHTWKNPHRVVELARVVAGVRPGYSPASADSELLKKVELFEFPGVWVSSSEIRRRAETGRNISYLVPENVESYIRSRGLYGTEGH